MRVPVPRHERGDQSASGIHHGARERPAANQRAKQHNEDRFSEYSDALRFGETAVP